MSATTPLTKSARHQRIIDIVTAHPVRSQTELADLLGDHGVHVTQATLSRDLVELDAVKVRGADGALVYAVPGEGGDRSVVGPRDCAAGRDNRRNRRPRHHQWATAAAAASSMSRPVRKRSSVKGALILCGSSRAIVCAKTCAEPGVALKPPVPQPQLT